MRGAVRACSSPPSGLALLPPVLIRLIFRMAAPSPANFLPRNVLESMKVDELTSKLKSLDPFAYKSNKLGQIGAFGYNGVEYKTELINELQRVLASKHWPRVVVVTGAGKDNVNGVYELTDCKKLARLSRWFRFPSTIYYHYAGISDIIWLKRGDHSSRITYIRPESTGSGVNMWGFCTLSFPTASSGFDFESMGRQYCYVTTKDVNVCQHPFDLSHQTSSWKTINDSDFEPVPKFSFVYEERRAWGLALGLIMTSLTRHVITCKFGETTLDLSLPDYVAYRWCLKHYGGVKSLQNRWNRSRAKTWIAFVAGGNG